MINQDKSLTKINWPDEFNPSRVPVYVRNEIKINAKPEVVWAWLVRAKRWPEYYPNSANVEYANKETNKLKKGTSFTWKTFGFNLISKVMELQENKRLSWDAKAFGIKAYHGWFIEKTDDGCIVTTEETQHGFLCVLGKIIFPKRMYNNHQIWLEQLKIKAESGMPK